MARISRRRAKRRIRQLWQEVTRERSVLLVTAVGQTGRRGPLGIPRALFFVYRVAPPA
jgi:hypothetical protein